MCNSPRHEPHREGFYLRKPAKRTVVGLDQGARSLRRHLCRIHNFLRRQRLRSNLIGLCSNLSALPNAGPTARTFDDASATRRSDQGKFDVNSPQARETFPAATGPDGKSGCALIKSICSMLAKSSGPRRRCDAASVQQLCLRTCAFDSRRGGSGRRHRHRNPRPFAHRGEPGPDPRGHGSPEETIRARLSIPSHPQWTVDGAFTVSLASVSPRVFRDQDYLFRIEPDHSMTVFFSSPQGPASAAVSIPSPAAAPNPSPAAPRTPPPVQALGPNPSDEQARRRSLHPSDSRDDEDSDLSDNPPR